MKKSCDKENGRSMIEMLGVLAIIGVLSVVGIAGYSKAMHRYRLNKTIEQITQIAGNVRAFFAPQKSYGGVHLNTALWKKAGLIPDDMWFKESNSSSETVKNVYGGYVSIQITRKNANDTTPYHAFAIMYDNIPQEVCIELATQDWNNAQGAAINVGSYYRKTPMNLETAIAACSSENSNTIYVFFDVDVN